MSCHLLWHNNLSSIHKYPIFWNCLPKFCFLHFLLSIVTVEWLNFIKSAHITSISSQDFQGWTLTFLDSFLLVCTMSKSSEIIGLIWTIFIKFSHSNISMQRRKCRKHNFGKQFQIVCQNFAYKRRQIFAWSLVGK